MPVEPAWQRSHLAVPRADEAVLALPPLVRAADAARANAAALTEQEVDVQGRPLSRLRREAKAEVLRLAAAYTADVLGDSAAAADLDWPLVVTGHQPLLYHPGVWAKNFAAAGLAARLGGGTLNLIIDNDVLTRSAVDAPAGTRDRPRTEPITFDAARPARVWEGAAVRDAATFRSFGERVAGHMRAWNVEPLIEPAWPAAVERLGVMGSLPECLAAARHAVEASWGVHNLELPMGRLCETDPFLRVACHVLAHLPRFADVYNGVLDEYRGLYRIKSRNHPVPALERRDDWLEAPFWVWRDDAPRRRRVFARQQGNRLSLADDGGTAFAELPLAPEMDACCAVEVLRALPRPGVRFRTRALTTTLFARVFLADLFVHGIGGAKYDEMTDRIIARFLGVPVPAFTTVSASVYLPFAEPFGASAEDERRLVATLRDLSQNPQRHLARGDDPQTDLLLDERAALVAEQDAAAVSGLSQRQRRSRTSANRSRFRRLKEVTVQLAVRTADQRERAERDLADLRTRRAADRVLTSREFSFALYPEAKLRPFLTALARGDR